jgi:hypothetical protein
MGGMTVDLPPRQRPAAGACRILSIETVDLFNIGLEPRSASVVGK